MAKSRQSLGSTVGTYLTKCSGMREGSLLEVDKGSKAGLRMKYESRINMLSYLSS